MRCFFTLFRCFLILCLGPSLSSGAEQPSEARERIANSHLESEASESPELMEDVRPLKLPNKRKGRVAVENEKEAEGTKAPNRFDAEVILRSRYERNGQPMEVDPD